MTRGEVQDVVRDFVGRDNIKPNLMTFAVDSGLREIEKRINAWWMRRNIEFNATDGNQFYLIRSAASGGLNLPNYKDVMMLLSKSTTDTLWERVLVTEFDIAEQVYATDSTGEPQMAVIDNDRITLFPPDPNDTWNMKMYYWQFTSLPTDETSDDHEVLRFWPEALIYAATMHLTQYLTKDVQMAAPYSGLFEAEFRKLDRYNKDREIDEHNDLVPHAGPTWPRKFRRLRSPYSWVT